MLTLIIFTNTSNMANQKVRVNFFRNESEFSDLIFFLGLRQAFRRKMVECTEFESELCRSGYGGC